jgi:hypothetical protein
MPLPPPVYFLRIVWESGLFEHLFDTRFRRVDLTDFQCPIYPDMSDLSHVW